MAFRKGSTRQLRRLIPESFFNRPAGHLHTARRAVYHIPAGNLSSAAGRYHIAAQYIIFQGWFSHVLLPPIPLTPEELAPLLASLPSPCYAVDLDRLEANLEILDSVQKEARCKILLAQKAFSFPEVYPQIANHLAGTTASGLYEARLGMKRCPGRKSTSTSPPTCRGRWRN